MLPLEIYFHYKDKVIGNFLITKFLGGYKINLEQDIIYLFYLKCGLKIY